MINNFNPLLQRCRRTFPPHHYYADSKLIRRYDWFKQCAGKDIVVMVARLFVAHFFLRYDSYTIDQSSSSLTFTILNKTTSWEQNMQLRAMQIIVFDFLLDIAGCICILIKPWICHSKCERHLYIACTGVFQSCLFLYEFIFICVCISNLSSISTNG